MAASLLPLWCSLQSVARPDGARLDRRHDVLGEVRAQRKCGLADSRHAAAEKSALGGDQRRQHVLAEALAQDRTQVAQPIDQTVAERRLGSPILAREQGIFRARQARAAAPLDEADEGLVDLALERLEVRDVVRVLRQEWIEHHLLLARRIDPPLDAELM